MARKGRPFLTVYTVTKTTDGMDRLTCDSMEAWTCVTSGETDEHDEDFETAFPEVFLSEAEAVKCALDDLGRSLKDNGEKPSSVKKILEKAEKSLSRCGVFQYEVFGGAVRRWDIWHTPVGLSGELPKMSLTRRKIYDA